jgi:hypothetical protein
MQLHCWVAVKLRARVLGEADSRFSLHATDCMGHAHCTCPHLCNAPASPSQTLAIDVSLVVMSCCVPHLPLCTTDHAACPGCLVVMSCCVPHLPLCTTDHAACPGAQPWTLDRAPALMCHPVHRPCSPAIPADTGHDRVHPDRSYRRGCP